MPLPAASCPLTLLSVPGGGFISPTRGLVPRVVQGPLRPAAPSCPLGQGAWNGRSPHPSLAAGSLSFSIWEVLLSLSLQSLLLSLLHLLPVYSFLGTRGWTCRLHPWGTVPREGTCRVDWESLPLPIHVLGGQPPVRTGAPWPQWAPRCHRLIPAWLGAWWCFVSLAGASRQAPDGWTGLSAGHRVDAAVRGAVWG